MDDRIRHFLYQHLVGPAEELLSGKKIVYLVPHGPLHYIPFQALIAADGDTFLRADGPLLIHAPSTSALFHTAAESILSPIANTLTLGYNNHGRRRLRHAEPEAEHIAHLTQGQVLSGTRAKKAQLYAQAANYRLLHFACHCQFLPESPLESFLSLAADERLTAVEVMEHLTLTCELVVLSACDSGLSHIRRGDELDGFLRAFMHAGATRLVTTLWRVHDVATQILMHKFYEQLLTDIPVALALKQAQLFLKNLTRREAQQLLQENIPNAKVNFASHVPENGRVFQEPRYWAPFILVSHGEAQL